LGAHMDRPIRHIGEVRDAGIVGQNAGGRVAIGIVGVDWVDITDAAVERQLLNRQELPFQLKTFVISIRVGRCTDAAGILVDLQVGVVGIETSCVQAEFVVEPFRLDAGLIGGRLFRVVY